MFILKRQLKWIRMGIFVGVILFLGCDKFTSSKNKSLLPDKALDSKTIKVDFKVSTDLKQTTYILPEQDKQRIISIIEEIASKQINTNNMDYYYSTFGFSVQGIPSSETLLTSPPENKTQYRRLFYQNGFIRVKSEIQNGSEKIKAKVFYNDKGAPILVAEPFGNWYNCYFFEYDEAGYLKRRSRISNIRTLENIAIYEIEPGYKNVIQYDFIWEEDNRFKLWERYRYSSEGSFVWSAKSGEEKRYSHHSFIDKIKILGKYNLAPIFPIPE